MLNRTVSTLAAASVALLAAWPALAVGARSAVPVLMYHKIDADVPRDPVGRDLTVTPDAFEGQLRWLRAHRTATLTAEAMAGALRAGRATGPAVVLTFDDGYADAATVALPIMKRYGAVGTFYISAGFIGTPRHLTWAQIRALRAAGNEVACHGTYHLDLSTLDTRGQREEIEHCLRAFRRYLDAGWRGRTYAYPAGQYNALTLSLLRGLGFVAAFTERPGAVTSLASPYELPRRRVRHDDGIARFAAVATP